MNQLLQRILLGFNNQQTINFLKSARCVDILPSDLDTILDYFNQFADENSEELAPRVPDLDAKNRLNGIDAQQFDQMRDDIVAFQDIEEAIRHDKAGTMRKKYKNAIKLLNLEYMAKFQKEFPEFVIQAAKTHRTKTNCDDVMTIQFIGILHYMYSVCDIGIRS